MEPVVTLVIDNGRVVSDAGDPVASALVQGVLIGTALWHWVRVMWWVGRRRRRLDPRRPAFG